MDNLTKIFGDRDKKMKKSRQRKRVYGKPLEESTPSSSEDSEESRETKKVRRCVQRVDSNDQIKEKYTMQRGVYGKPLEESTPSISEDSVESRETKRVRRCVQRVDSNYQIKEKYTMQRATYLRHIMKINEQIINEGQQQQQKSMKLQTKLMFELQNQDPINWLSEFIRTTSRSSESIDSSIEKLDEKNYLKFLEMIDKRYYHKFYVEALIKLLKRWYESQPIDESDCVALFDYLKHHLGIMKKYYIEDRLEITCSLIYLKQLFGNRNKWTTYPEYIYNWPHVHIQINLPGFSMYRKISNIDSFYMRHSTSGTEEYEKDGYIARDMEVILNNAEKSRSLRSQSIVSYLGKIERAILKHSKGDPKVVAFYVEVFRLFKIDLKLSPDIVFSGEYRCILNRHPYVRDIMAKSLSKFSIIQYSHPQLIFSVEKAQSIKELDNLVKTCDFRDMVTFKCDLCDFRLSTDRDFNDHFQRYHGYDADWTCLLCKKTFTTNQLSECRWAHSCNPTFHVINELSAKDPTVSLDHAIEHVSEQLYLEILKSVHPRFADNFYTMVLIELLKHWYSSRTIDCADTDDLFDFIKLHILAADEYIVKELEITCSRRELRTFTRYHLEPKLAINNIDNWSHISMKFELIGFSMSRRIELNESIVIEKASASRSCPTNIPIHPTKADGKSTPISTNVILNFVKQIILVISKQRIQPEKKFALIAGMNEFISDIKLMGDTILSHNKYYRNLSTYPYVRRIGQIESTEDVNMYEYCSPQVCFSIDNASVFDNTNKNTRNVIHIDSMMKYKCNLCDENLNMSSQRSVKEHFEKFHDFESDWSCTKCFQSLSTNRLAKSRWNHNCYVQQIPD